MNGVIVMRMFLTTKNSNEKYQAVFFKKQGMMKQSFTTDTARKKMIFLRDTRRKTDKT